MIEVTGDIFEQKDADCICFTSNGILNKNGDLVMGAGIAKEFKTKWRRLPEFFGRCIKKRGNTVFMMDIGERRGEEHRILWICNFPTKHHWKDPSDINLIKTSALELVKYSNLNKVNKIYLPRPGTGLGGLKWEDVKKVIEPILDDRFIVINKE